MIVYIEDLKKKNKPVEIFNGLSPTKVNIKMIVFLYTYKDTCVYIRSEFLEFVNVTLIRERVLADVIVRISI